VRRVLGVVSFVAFWSLAALAAAQPAALPLELSWQAPQACPSADDVRGELSRIARARAGRTLRPLTATVHVHKTSSGFHAALRTELDGQAGERELRAADCATLARSVTLVLALAFGPDIELDAREPLPASTDPRTSDPAQTTAPEPPPEPAAEPEPLSPAEPEDDDDTPSSRQLGMLLGGGTNLTLLPAPCPLLTAGVLLELSTVFMLQLRFSALPAVTEAIAPAADARFDGLATTALGCGRLASVLELCGGAHVAALRARASGLFRDDSTVAPYYGLFASTGAVWPSTGPVRIGLEAALILSLYRPRFAAHGLGPVHHAPLLAPELSVQLQLWP
jgi:hypothetical protein